MAKVNYYPSYSTRDLAKQLDTALASLALLLDGHGPSCICCHCYALAQGQATMEGMWLLCAAVDAQARTEWETKRPGPFTEVSNACFIEI